MESLYRKYWKQNRNSCKATHIELQHTPSSLLYIWSWWIPRFNLGKAELLHGLTAIRSAPPSRLQRLNRERHCLCLGIGTYITQNLQNHGTWKQLDDYRLYTYLEPQWSLFLMVKSPKTRPFPIKTRVIWVPARLFILQLLVQIFSKVQVAYSCSSLFEHILIFFKFPNFKHVGLEQVHLAWFDATCILASSLLQLDIWCPCHNGLHHWPSTELYSVYLSLQCSGESHSC